MDDFFANIDAVITIYFPDLVEANDKGTMDAHELLSGQHLLNGLHREMGDQRTALTVEVKHHVVFHATDIDDVADGNLTILAVDLEEERCGLPFISTVYSLLTPGSFLSAKPLLGLINGGEEFIVADGLQEEVEGADLVRGDWVSAP